MSREKILIVDDDRDLLNGLNFLFRSEGYQVISATDGISAVNMAQTENLDLYMLQWAILTIELWARQFIDRNPAEGEFVSSDSKYS